MSQDRIHQLKLDNERTKEVLSTHWKNVRREDGNKINLLNQVVIQLTQYQGEIDSLVHKIGLTPQEVTQLERDELTLMLDQKYKVAQLDANTFDPYASGLGKKSLAKHTAYGSQCIYEEFSKISKTIHELYSAGMINEMKTMLNYLVTTQDRTSGGLLHINPNCYGLFGPALKSQEEIESMWDTTKPYLPSNWTSKRDITLTKRNKDETTTEEKYQVGLGKTGGEFSLKEVLEYRESIHVFFGDLMKLCNIDELALEALVIPVLDRFVRSEESVTIDFINTIMAYVPKDAMEAAAKVAGKFVKKGEIESDDKDSRDVDLSHIKKEATEATSEATSVMYERPKAEAKAIIPDAIINTCSIIGVDVSALLNTMTNGNFEKTVKEYKQEGTGNTLLHTAAMTGTPAAIIKLIASGGDINARNLAGETPADLVPADKPEVLQAFQGEVDGRTTPISGELKARLAENEASNLGDDPNFEALFEGVNDFGIIAQLRYLYRATDAEFDKATGIEDFPRIFRALLDQTNALSKGFSCHNASEDSELSGDDTLFDGLFD